MASGKSTVARLLAEQTKSFYINSGLLFRALAFLLLEKRVQPESILHDLPALTQFVKECLFYSYNPKTGPVVSYKNLIITPFLKTSAVSSAASILATESTVRQVFLTYQRTLAENHDVVADGRDCGTVVFPAASFKFFITAHVTVRAQRFQQDKERHNVALSLEESIALVHERDTRDSMRIYAPLKPSSDSCILDNSSLTIQETLDCILSLIDFQK